MHIFAEKSDTASSRRGSFDPDSADEQSHDENERRGSKHDYRHISLRWCVMWLVVIALAVIILVGGCSNEAKVRTGGGVALTKSSGQDRIASSRRLSAEEIRGLSEEQLNRAIMAPFTVQAYDQSRKRQWVFQATDAREILAKRERPPHEQR